MRANAGSNEGTNTFATGADSRAEGNGTSAGGTNSHAEGWQTSAGGFTSHAEGYQANALGAVAHAEGTGTVAGGDYSHAEGNTTTANATAAHAEGGYTSATGTYSHAEGISTTASGSYAHAEGQNTTASGQSSHAEGWGTLASAYVSHAQGYGAVASRQGEDALASGRFNTPSGANAQCSTMVLRTITADATPKTLAAGIVGEVPTVELAGQTISVLTLTASRAFQLKISTVARRTDVQGEMAGWTWEGLVGRDSTGNARIIGTPVQAAWGDAPVTDPWDVAVSINTTDAVNNYVAVTATGQAAKTIRWVAKMEWVEVAG